MILCCGEALIDMIPEQTVLGPDGYVPRSGGAIFNTAYWFGSPWVSHGSLKRNFDRYVWPSACGRSEG
jgi:fructokinase